MSSNIFGGGGEKTHEEFKEKVDTHSKALITVVERQKDLESSVDLLGEKLDLVDHNAVKNFKKIFNDMKSIRDDIRDLKSEITNLKDYNSKITKQLKIMTTKDEVTKLEKYIDLWNPMDFMTRHEVEDMNKKNINEIKKIIEGFLKE